MEDLLVVKLNPKFKRSPYKKINVNSSYTVSLLNKDKISFINVSGRFNTSSFVTIKGDKIPTNIIVEYNVFDANMRYDDMYFVKCLENTPYPDLNVGDIYVGHPFFISHHESSYLIYIDGVHRKISHFKTVDKKEYLVYSRYKKIKTIFDDL